MLLARRAGIVLLIVLIMVALGAATAGAKKKHKKKHKSQSWDSTVTLSHPASTQFTGSVGSKLGACRGSRVVTLYYTDPSTGQVLPLSVQRTDGNGYFQVDLTKPAFAGDYQVIVEERQVRAMKATQTCRGVTSTVLTV